MNTRVLLAIALGAGSLGLWFAVYTVALLMTRPARPQPYPAAQELPGAEPPAVVSLLAGYWDLSEDAAESTLVDLGARKYLEFRQPGNDPMQTTIHVRNANPAGLTGYERRVLERVCGLAVGGVVPLTALTFRDQSQAGAFEKRVRAEVIADARQRGLSRARFSPAIRTLLTLLGLFASIGVVAAIVVGVRHVGDVRGLGGAWVVSFGVLNAIAHRN